MLAVRIFLYMQDVKVRGTISVFMLALFLGWAFPAFVLASYRGEEIAFSFSELDDVFHSSQLCLVT